MATRLLTEAELRLEYADAVITKLADRNGDTLADAGVVEGAILDAEDEALSRLRGRFSDAEIPATPGATARRVKVLVAGVAYYNLHKHLAVIPQRAKDARADGREGLDSIRSGELSALLADSPPVDSGRVVVSSSKRSTDLQDQAITLEAMRGWGHR